MTDDLISRQAAIDKLDPLFESLAIDKIRALPSAQSEIIHCGDCRHWKNNHLCKHLSRYGTFETEIDFYCGFAERREE